MKVLVACEESQEVCKAFRALGHEAYSADIQEPSGGHPEWHILGDVLPIINGRCTFRTMDGEEHAVDGTWDLLIAHPPCTDLAVSGARWFPEKRADGRQQRAIRFFMAFAHADCGRIAIENPVCIMSSVWRKPDQIIQPWKFGHGETKATCLWLKGLTHLEPTNIVEGREPRVWKCPPGKDRAKMRSKTFEGIAKAMAEQWGGMGKAITHRNPDCREVEPEGGITMSMTREEAIAVLEESKRQNEIMRDNPSTFWASHQMADGVKNAERRIAALDLTLSALRPVSREQVEKVFSGCEMCREKKEVKSDNFCGAATMRIVGDSIDLRGDEKKIKFFRHIYEPSFSIRFCPFCGKPRTDEAVEMVMERLEVLKDADTDH